MKKILIISLFSLFQIALLAQEYFPFDTVGTSWNEFKELGDGNKTNEKWIENYFLSGDTVIESLKYFKIYEKNDSCDSYVGCFREQDKIVWYKGIDYFGFECDTATILYDFTDNLVNSEIVTIDSILISGKYRKKYNFSGYESWIEGIGSTLGFLYPITTIPTKVYFRSELTCFKKDECIIFLSPNFSDCTTQIIQIIDEVSKESFFKVYPNPANGNKEIIIESKTLNVNMIKLYSINGQLLYTEHFKNNQLVKINLSKYSSNFYILKIVDSLGNFYTNKLIIE